MRKCKTCSIEKPVTEFYGRNHHCKDCYKKRVKERQNTPEGKAAHREANRRYAASKKGRVTNGRAMSAWSENNKKKLLAKWAVARAIKLGVLVRKPCEVCGKTTTHAHHPDYDRQLHVMWLCPIHHKEWHAIHGEGRNAA